MKKKWWNSLQVKIIAWSFIPAVIILSAVAWVTFYSYQMVIGDQAIKQYPEIIQPKALTFNQTISGIANSILLPVIMDLDVNHELPIDVRAQNILDQAQGLDYFDGGIFFLDKQGKVFKSQPLQSELIGQDWSDTFHFRSVKANPNLGAWTDLMTIEASGNKVFCVAIAMAGQTWDEVLGVAYYCFKVYPVSQNIYYQKVNSLNLGSNVYVVDRNQQIVYSPDPTEMGKDLSAEPYIQELSQGESNSGRFRIGTEDMVISYIPLFGGVPSERAGWYMLAEQSWAEIMEPTLPYRQLLYGLMAFGVLIPVLVTAYGVRHITTPIQKLIRAAEQVTAGQFQQRIDVKTGDEIETLADQFNIMSEKLDESYSSLEKKVAERTHELATLNAIAARVSSSLNLNEIMADALERIMELTGMEHGVAYRIAGGEGGASNTAEEAHLRVMAFRGLPPTYSDLGDRLPLRQSAAGVAGRRGEPVIWTLVELPTESTIRERLTTLGVEQIIAIPLMAKERLVGSLNLSTNHSRTYPPEQIALLKTIGQQIGVAVENARLYEQAEQAGITTERQRLARELHDAVTQTLFSANLIADVLPRIWKRNPEEGLKNVEELRQLTRGALAEMRTLLLEMRPESLMRSDINSLLKQLADAYIGRARIPLNLDINGECEITHDVKLVFYRVAQEALNNIARHSGARQVDIHLQCQPGQMNLQIKDDGLGFESGALTPDHLGITIMRERAVSIGAHLNIESQVGEGTTVELDWKSARED